jgi:hypothetical protein
LQGGEGRGEGNDTASPGGYTISSTYCTILYNVTRSQIHERTISLRFLGIILRVFRLEVSV